MKKMILLIFLPFIFVGCGNENQKAETSQEAQQLPSYDFLWERLKILSREYGYMTQYIDEKTQTEYGEIQQFMQAAVDGINDKGDRSQILENIDQMEQRLRKLAPKINYQIAIEEVTIE